MPIITTNIHVRDDDAIKANVGIDRPDIRWVQIGSGCAIHASPAQMRALRDAITTHLDSLGAIVSAQAEAA